MAQVSALFLHSVLVSGIHVHAINLTFLTVFNYRDVPPDVPWTGGSGICWTWSQRYIACIHVK